MPETVHIPDFLAVTLGFAVFLIGANINRRVEVLRQFNIPEPVTGGLLAALIVLPLWKGAHHVRSLLIDFGGAERDGFVGSVLYLIALVGSGMGVAAVVGL